MIVPMRSFVILALLCLVEWSTQWCPEKYERFTPHHSFCLAPNASCNLIDYGVSQQDKDLILRLHNEFRSKVAMGNEHRARDGSLPQAADMLQMVWDDELASVAEKWARNCHYGHDCDECREVENFPVGQNLARQYYYGLTNEPDWTWAITALYNEVTDYYRRWLASFVEHPGPKTGHLTQIIWSKSWRVGCGYSFFSEGGVNSRYYACNYGPGGNVQEQPVYKQGRPCSACPSNTQCSTSKGWNSYPGLCKMNDPNSAPAPTRNPNSFFFCGSPGNDPDCQVTKSGDGSLKTIRSLGGNYYSIVLNGGQSATLAFNNPLKPPRQGYCLVFYLRKGPLDSTRRDSSSLKASFKMGYSTGSSDLQFQKPSFILFNVPIPSNKEAKLSLTFSVPSGAGEHVLDLRKVEAFSGSCN